MMALRDEHDRVIDRFGREVVLLVGLEPKHFPRHVKACDLTATLVKELATAHRSADHFVEVFGRLAFAEDRHVAGV